MAEFTVTSSELKNKASELEKQNDQLKQKIELLETEEKNLRSMWEGKANTAFSSSFQTDKVKMTQFYVNMKKYIAALRTIAAKYETAENANVVTAASSN